MLISTHNARVIDTYDAVGGSCLCLAARKAARSLSRRYDEALRPFGLTSGQFSVLVAVAQDAPLGMTGLARELGMDRTTLTAALKPLERDGLVSRFVDTNDRRARRWGLTASGRATLAAAMPAWRLVQAATVARAGADVATLRANIQALA
jgi:DNA-binding MarR family transcriptional regulator